MGRARPPGAARPGRAPARGPGDALSASRGAGAALAGLALAAGLGCGQLGTDFDAVIALEVILPDSGVVEVGDTLQPAARPLNGRGDSVAASVYWGALDTAIALVLDSATGATLGRQGGRGRIQARVGTLRSNPVALIVQPPLDSIRAAGDLRDTVTVSGATRDTLSDSLRVRVFAPSPPSETLLRRRVTYTLDVFPSAGRTVTLVPNDTVFSDASGIAIVQVRLDSGSPPDSVRVTARAARHDGTAVPGTPLFVVEFRP